MKHRVGFFLEFGYDVDDDPSLADAVGATEAADPRVVEYLKSGRRVAVSPGVVIDPLSRRADVLGAGAILTDGLWEWPNEFGYLVERYRVPVPTEFIDRMRRLRWRVPRKATSDKSSMP